MEVFAFEVQVSPICEITTTGEAFRLDAKLRHFGSKRMRLGHPFGGEPLKLGILAFAEKQDEPVFENRARFASIELDAFLSHDFAFEIPRDLAETSELLLVFHFVREGEFWFRDRGVEPSMLALTYNGHQLETRLADRLEFSGSVRPGGVWDWTARRTPDKLYDKSSPEFLAAVSAGVASLSEAFGAVLAIEFAYYEILGRRADPLGLVEKSRNLVSDNNCATRICSQMIGSDEYAYRRLDRHRDPVAVMKSWASLCNE